MTDPCRVSIELNRHEEIERDAVRDVEAYMGKALEDLVWRIMNNEERCPFDLSDFLADQHDLPELMTRVVLTNGLPLWAMDEIEKRLRQRLEDSDEVAERAAEMAKEE